MARALNFQISGVEGLYCLCSENKGTDQLHGYRTADLRLCFHICKKQISYDAAQIEQHQGLQYIIGFCGLFFSPFLSN